MIGWLGRVGSTAERRQKRRGAPTWALALGFAVTIGWLDLVQALHGLPALGVFALGLAALALAGWFWGYDSRDGADWKPPARRYERDALRGPETGPGLQGGGR